MSADANSTAVTAPAAAEAPEVTNRESDDLRDAGSEDGFTPAPPPKKKRTYRKKESDEEDATALIFKAALLPAPYYYYRNHSTEMDEDPLTPVTQAGHVPCFPAKMHAILASPDLNDIVAWDDHGRSFRILKPKRFECYILPKFFEHNKFSSFIRQTNGWGFRRFLSGPNRNSYYHEYFLRSMPWLCKKMRRPRPGEKKGISLDYEPDLRIISQQFPVPNNPMTREIQIVLETMKRGPRARMPVHWAAEPLPPAALAPIADRNVAAMPNVQAMAAASANSYGMGASVNTMNAFQTSSPEMLTFLRSLEQSKLANTATATSENNRDSFAAGFRAATQFANHASMNPMNGMVMPPRQFPLAAGSTASASAMTPQGNAEYMRLLQMHMAAQGMGTPVGAAAMPSSGQRQGGLTLDQLQAFQAGLWNPNSGP